MLAGDLAAAERELRGDYDELHRMGEKTYLALTAALLALALCMQGRYPEAEEFSEVSQKSANPDDVEAQVLWRCARGKTLAATGDAGEGEVLLREALTLIEQTEQPDIHGMVLLDLARLLSTAGRPEEAAPLARRASELFEQKGNVVSRQSATALLERLASVG
jgi:tetratricopeptide (TPR) repeat protein